jgi:hypothetical protein
MEKRIFCFLGGVIWKFLFEALSSEYYILLTLESQLSLFIIRHTWYFCYLEKELSVLYFSEYFCNLLFYDTAWFHKGKKSKGNVTVSLNLLTNASGGTTIAHIAISKVDMCAFPAGIHQINQIIQPRIFVENISHSPLWYQPITLGMLYLHIQSGVEEWGMQVVHVYHCYQRAVAFSLIKYFLIIIIVWSGSKF